MLANPQELGEREVGERGIASKANETIGSELAGELLHLVVAALVAPDDGGAHDFFFRIEDDCAVHLAGEAYASDVRGIDLGLLRHLPNGKLAGAPPIMGILLGPARAGRGEVGVICGADGHDAAGGVDEERPRAARADIDAEEIKALCRGQSTLPSLRSGISI